MKLNLLVKSDLTIEERKIINELIDLNNGVVFQEPLLNEIVSQTFKTELKYYLIFNNNEIISYCSGHIRKNKFLSIIELKPPFDIPYGGFIVNEKSTNINDILELLPGRNFTKYIYSTPPIFSEEIPSIKYKNFLKKETPIVDLSKSEDYIWGNFINSKRRNMIRKALKQGITTQIYDNEEGLKLFWPLLNDLHKNLGYDQLTYQYYKNILDIYFCENKASIILSQKDREIIAGVIIIGNKNFMHYWKGASKFNIKNDGQGDLLQWEAIKFSKKYGAKYYDLCVIDKENLPDIAQFKLGFSQNLIPFYSFSKSSIVYKVINRIQNAN